MTETEKPIRAWACQWQDKNIDLLLRRTKAGALADAIKWDQQGEVVRVIPVEIREIQDPPE